MSPVAWSDRQPDRRPGPVRLDGDVPGARRELGERERARRVRDGDPPRRAILSDDPDAPLRTGEDRIGRDRPQGAVDFIRADDAGQTGARCDREYDLGDRAVEGDLDVERERDERDRPLPEAERVDPERVEAGGRAGELEPAVRAGQGHVVAQAEEHAGHALPRRGLDDAARDHIRPETERTAALQGQFDANTKLCRDPPIPKPRCRDVPHHEETGTNRCAETRPCFNHTASPAKGEESVRLLRPAEGGPGGGLSMPVVPLEPGGPGRPGVGPLERRAPRPANARQKMGPTTLPREAGVGHRSRRCGLAVPCERPRLDVDRAQHGSLSHRRTSLPGHTLRLRAEPVE